MENINQDVFEKLLSTGNVDELCKTNSKFNKMCEEYYKHKVRVLLNDTKKSYRLLYNRIKSYFNDYYVVESIEFLTSLKKFKNETEAKIFLNRSKINNIGEGDSSFMINGILSGYDEELSYEVVFYPNVNYLSILIADSTKSTLNEHDNQVTITNLIKDLNAQIYDSYNFVEDDGNYFRYHIKIKNANQKNEIKNRIKKYYSGFSLYLGIINQTKDDQYEREYEREEIIVNP
jgi:hypothetical protein